MPRGVKTNKSDSERIAELEASKVTIQEKIDKWKTKLATIDFQIEEIKESQKRQKVEGLIDVVDESGFSPDEIKEIILNAQKTKTV